MSSARKSSLRCRPRAKPTTWQSCATAEGIGNYLRVLSAEAPLLAQQSPDADLRSRQLALAINLIRALGGGFDEAAISVAAAH